MFKWLRDKMLTGSGGESNKCEEMFDPIIQQLISSMRGPLPKRDLVSDIFDPVLKNKKYKKLTIRAVQLCVDNYQDSHPK
tara:strand:- start:201 stop:440 length:240 start_codon:yes stop_codon:yes gene_type:complete